MGFSQVEKDCVQPADQEPYLEQASKANQQVIEECISGYSEDGRSDECVQYLYSDNYFAQQTVSKISLIHKSFALRPTACYISLVCNATPPFRRAWKYGILWET